MYEEVKDKNFQFKGRWKLILLIGIVTLSILSVIAASGSPFFTGAAVSTTQQELTYKIVPLLANDKAQGEGTIHFSGLQMDINVALHKTPTSPTCQSATVDCTFTIALLIEGQGGTQTLNVGTATSGQGGEMVFHGHATFPSTGTFQVGLRLYLEGELAFTSDPILQTVVLL